MINYITSIKDPAVELARSLSTPKGRHDVFEKCYVYEQTASNL
jgi:hypothetical protein